MSTWFSRSLSPSSSSGRLPRVCSAKRWDLARAWGSIMAYRSSTSWGRLNSDTFRLVLPLSILLMSRMSLMRLSRCWLEEEIFRVYSRTFSGCSASRPSSTEKPTMAFMGVRMSWDMLARKLLLASLAALAVWRASPRASYICRSWVRSESMRMNWSLSSRVQWWSSCLNRRSSWVLAWRTSRSPVHIPPTGTEERTSAVSWEGELENRSSCPSKRMVRASARTASGSMPRTRSRLGLTYWA